MFIFLMHNYLKVMELVLQLAVLQSANDHDSWVQKLGFLVAIVGCTLDSDRFMENQGYAWKIDGQKTSGIQLML